LAPALHADQLVVVSALANPEPRPRLIDRCLVAAYDAGLEPLLVLTKADLVEPDAFLAAYAPLAVRYVVTRRDPSDPAAVVGIDEIREHLAGRVSVLIGHSGVGKSTIVNRLVPDAERAVGIVNDVTGRGRHTSTSTVALPLPGDDGWVIDGNYSSKLGDLVVRAADTVVWLDLPMRVWLPRLLRRTVRRVRTKEELWNGNRESLRGALWGRDALIPFALRTHRERRRTYPGRFAGYRTVRLCTPAAVEAFLSAAGAP